MRLRALTLSASLLAGLWLACGDDYGDGSNAPLVGDTGGKCFDDGTCKVGLICLSSLCVAPPDSGITDSGTTSREGGKVFAEGGPDATFCPPGQAADTQEKAISCAGDKVCGAGSVCCFVQDKTWLCEAFAECDPTENGLRCDTNDDCNPGLRCCLVAAEQLDKCGRPSLTRSFCKPSCDASEYTSCEDESDTCPSGNKCGPVDFVLASTDTTLRRDVCLH